MNALPLVDNTGKATPLKKLEEAIVVAAVQRNAGNKKKAAEELRIDERTLRIILKRTGWQPTGARGNSAVKLELARCS